MKARHTKGIRKKQLLIIVLIVTALGIMYSFSKYAIQLSSTNIQTAEQFYFESEILKEEGASYELKDWDGASRYTLEITLKNYADSLRYTKSDIKYEVEGVAVTEGITVTTSLTADNTTISGTEQGESKFYIYVDPTSAVDEGEYVEFSVTANATSPYAKSLTANFKLFAKSQGNGYEATISEENNQYVDLVINTQKENKNITINYDNSKLMLDTTNTAIQDSAIIKGDTTNSININLKSNSEYNIGFIKKNADSTIILGTDIEIK